MVNKKWHKKLLCISVDIATANITTVIMIKYELI